MGAEPPRDRSLFLLVLVAVSGFRAWFATSLPLSGDEAYHWEWSRHLAPAYWDHPGMTALLIRLAGLVVPGTSELAVRLPAILCLAGAAAASYALARRVALRQGASAARAERAGLLAGVLLMCLPVYAALGIYMSTDPPLVLFTATGYYLLHRALEPDPGEDGRWSSWLGSGVCLGLAAGTKFLAFLLVPVAGIVLLVHRPYRRFLREPRPYAALAVATLVFTPVLAWNAGNDWATFYFNFEHRHSFEFSPHRVLEYVGGQALLLTPWIFAAAVGAFFGAWKDERRAGDGSTRLLVVATLVPLGFFLPLAFLRSVGMHWTAAYWVTGVVLLACRWASAERLRPWMRGALAATVIFTLSMHGIVHLPTPWVSAGAQALGDTDLDASELNERYGWRELGRRLGEVRAEMERGGSSRVALLTDQYGLASAASFYSPGRPHVLLWAPRHKHGESYRIWDDFPKILGSDACFFSKRLSRLEDALPSLREHFARVGDVEELHVEHAGRRVRAFYLLRCYGYDGRPRG